jgi:hypothetical protein
MNRDELLQIKLYAAIQMAIPKPLTPDDRSHLLTLLGIAEPTS